MTKADTVMAVIVGFCFATSCIGAVLVIDNMCKEERDRLNGIPPKKGRLR